MITLSDLDSIEGTIAEKSAKINNGRAEYRDLEFAMPIKPFSELICLARMGLMLHLKLIAATRSPEVLQILEKSNTPKSSNPPPDQF